ncbi:type II secretion system protein [bacterium]|nr:type II secretion system protein [bacterium]
MTNKLNQFTTHSSQFTNFAFTLAETLIVMGIIGVVAALTLPNLNSSTGDKEKVVKVKKAYTELQDAVARAKIVYGSLNEERIIEFLKITKNCGNTGSGCTQNYILSLNGTKKNESMQDCGYRSEVGYSYIMADGMSLGIAGYTDCLAIDIDGPNKGSSTEGKDIFYFSLDSKTGEVTPSGMQFTDAQLKESCFKTGASCTGWVIQNENMDYLKADRTGKCPNNVQLSWSNISCK